MSRHPSRHDHDRARLRRADRVRRYRPRRETRCKRTTHRAQAECPGRPMPGRPLPGNSRQVARCRARPPDAAGKAQCRVSQCRVKPMPGAAAFQDRSTGHAGFEGQARWTVALHLAASPRQAGRRSSPSPALPCPPPEPQGGRRLQAAGKPSSSEDRPKRRVIGLDPKIAEEAGLSLAGRPARKRPAIARRPPRKVLGVRRSGEARG